MKKTIKQLEARIEELEGQKSHWYNKFSELKDEKDKAQSKSMFNLESEKRHLSDQVANLLEIVRWHCNPRTAEAPFLPLKDQRDNGNKNY